MEVLKQEVKEKESIINKLESEYEVMNDTIGSYLRARSEIFSGFSKYFHFILDTGRLRDWRQRGGNRPDQR